jgi:hypothetical protein
MTRTKLRFGPDIHEAILREGPHSSESFQLGSRTEIFLLGVARKSAAASPLAFYGHRFGGRVFAIYTPALNFQFVLDDHRFAGDIRLQQAGHVWEYFTSYVWAQFTGGPLSFYRPVFLLWLRLNFILSEASPWGWHLLSVVKHLSVAVLLGWLVWGLLRDCVAALLAALCSRCIWPKRNRLRGSRFPIR